jgi:hypothetical protein
LDKFTSISPDLKKDQYQLVGLTSLWVASKFEEIYPTHQNYLVSFTSGVFSEEDMIEIERKIV